MTGSRHRIGVGAALWGIALVACGGDPAPPSGAAARADPLSAGAAPTSQARPARRLRAPPPITRPAGDLEGSARPPPRELVEGRAARPPGAGADAGAPDGSAADASADAPDDAPDDALDDASDDASDGDAGDGGPSYVGPVFAEVGAAAGFTYLQQPAQWALRCVLTDPACDVEARQETGGLAVGDYDGDGWFDVYATALGGPGTLLRNRGDGTFEDATHVSGLDAVVGDTAGALFADLDRDGDVDLYVTGFESTANHLFVNDGQGHFVDEAIARGAAIDPGTQRFGAGVTAGDYDRDGFLDLYAVEWHAYPSSTPWAGHDRLLRNLGAGAPGTFEEAKAALPFQLSPPLTVNSRGVVGFQPSFSDFDDDGWPDLQVAADFGTTRVFWGGASGFSDGTADWAGVLTRYSMSSTVADFDGDGRLDWFVSAIDWPGNPYHDGNRLLFGAGGRSVIDGTDRAGVRASGWAWGSSAFDYDNDGDLDLLVTNGMPLMYGPQFLFDATVLWRNRGDGTFEDVALGAGIVDTSQGRATVVLDHDGDGDLDVAIARSGETPLLYRNEGGNANDWLRLDLRAHASAPGGVGARVELVARPGDAPQVREVHSGGGYLACDEPFVHFGLGAPSADAVHEVRIRWPATGQTQVLHDLPRRATLVVDEP